MDGIEAFMLVGGMILWGIEGCFRAHRADNADLPLDPSIATVLAVYGPFMAAAAWLLNHGFLDD